MLCYLSFKYFSHLIILIRSVLNSPQVGASGRLSLSTNRRCVSIASSVICDCVYVFQASSWCWRPRLLQWLPRRATRAMPTRLQVTLLHPLLATHLNLHHMASTCKRAWQCLCYPFQLFLLYTHTHTFPHPNTHWTVAALGLNWPRRLYPKHAGTLSSRRGHTHRWNPNRNCSPLLSSTRALRMGLRLVDVPAPFPTPHHRSWQHEVRP